MRRAWINNAQAPYREPVFRELAKLVDLEISFFFAEERVRHWSRRPDPGYASVGLVHLAAVGAGCAGPAASTASA
jgi:hypothetical protein